MLFKSLSTTSKSSASSLITSLSETSGAGLSSSSIFSLSQQVRNTATRPSRYSPKLYSKDVPVDRGSMVFPSSPFFEAWSYRRDHYEKEFTWNTRNSFEAFYFIGGFTVAFYALGEFCLRHSDRRSGTPKRALLGQDLAGQFVVPDERDFF
ncbi:MAG: hypothetical protein WDW36_005280 [Sanguina aurantia]